MSERQPYDAEYYRDVARTDREHAEAVAAQSWGRFWAEGNAAKYSELSHFLKVVLITQRGTVPEPDSLWRFIDGEAIPA